MGKTLAVIINHNRKEYTNNLYNSLKPYEESGNYDLFVLDNGSTDPSEISEFTSFRSEENTYYGGALNMIFALMLENPQYDSVLALNNDYIVHPYNLVSSLRKYVFEEGYHIVTPCVFQPDNAQCFWKQMHNWGSSTPRDVKWVDFMFCVIRREVVEKIQQYDDELMYGWGHDVYTGIVCEEMGWKIGVVDSLSFIHLASQTFKDGKSNLSLNEYSSLAMKGMVNFFNRKGLGNKLNEFRNWGQHYTFNK